MALTLEDIHVYTFYLGPSHLFTECLRLKLTGSATAEYS